MSSYNDSKIEILRLSGQEIIPFLAEIAELRIKVFLEFPYLYVGSAEYEKKYLLRYTKSDESVVVLAKDGSQVIGASTGMPMKDEDKMVYTPFESNDMDRESFFYFGESVLLDKYRGQGLGVEFFREREHHALSHGYKKTTFCAVDRPIDHPRRPSNYNPLDQFWTKRGYTKYPQLKTTFHWKDLDDTTESPKSLTFWIKEHL
jgi:GNAT superfamily N-acetyltransferase